MADTETPAELGAKLDRLDPGGILAVEPRVLAHTFGAEGMSKELESRVQVFAGQHRCSFQLDQDRAEFVKSDIF